MLGNVFELGCVPTSYALDTGAFECSGRAIVEGTWNGTIAVYARSTAAIGSGTMSGRVLQKFSGISDDQKHGEIVLRGFFKIDGVTGEETVTTSIVKGTGAFQGAKGTVVYTLYNPLSAGPALGSYVGKWTHPAYK